MSNNRQTNELETDDEVTDGAITDGNGWIECRNKKSHHINRFGNPIAMIGYSFTVVKEYKKKFPYKIKKGKIVAVVKKPETCDHFKFYDARKFKNTPPLTNNSWYYLPCKRLMSLDKKVSNIKWDIAYRRSFKRYYLFVLYVCIVCIYVCIYGCIYVRIYQCTQLACF